MVEVKMFLIVLQNSNFFAEFLGILDYFDIAGWNLLQNPQL